MRVTKQGIKFIVLVALTLSAGDAWFSQHSEAIDAEYIQLTVQGKTYDVPIPNSKARDTFYYVKKALKGDNEAREILLAGQDKKFIFIGDTGVVRWLIIEKDKESVTEIRT